MYQHILVPIENSETDETILRHIRGLAKLTGARLTLLHVADGFMAQNQERFDESVEMQQDRAYLAQREKEFAAEGFNVKAVLLCGKPADQILDYAAREGCDLIAMATHGHRGLSDLMLGSVAHLVRHKSPLPLLLLKVTRP